MRKSAFVVSVCIAACLIACGGGGTSSVAAAKLCARAQACGLITSDQQEACQQELRSVEMYVVDPAQVVGACLEQGSCSQIQDQTFITQCLAYDTAAFHCTDTNTLHVCNTSTSCKDLDCTAACKNYVSGTRSAGCSYDTSAGYEKCFCYL